MRRFFAAAFVVAPGSDSDWCAGFPWFDCDVLARLVFCAICFRSGGAGYVHTALCLRQRSQEGSSLPHLSFCSLHLKQATMGLCGWSRVCPSSMVEMVREDAQRDTQVVLQRQRQQRNGLYTGWNELSRETQMSSSHLRGFRRATHAPHLSLAPPTLPSPSEPSEPPEPDPTSRRDPLCRQTVD